jgi:hypothetical protein
MLKGKLLRQALDKFLKNSEVSQNARVQVCLPNGELYDEFLAPCTKMKNFMKALAACRLQLMA